MRTLWILIGVGAISGCANINDPALLSGERAREVILDDYLREISTANDFDNWSWDPAGYLTAAPANAR